MISLAKLYCYFDHTTHQIHLSRDVEFIENPFLHIIHLLYRRTPAPHIPPITVNLSSPLLSPSLLLPATIEFDPFSPPLPAHSPPPS